MRLFVILPLFLILFSVPSFAYAQSVLGNYHYCELDEECMALRELVFDLLERVKVLETFHQIVQPSHELEIVINEVELNQGNSTDYDGIELYNPTYSEIDISGWTFTPTNQNSTSISNGTVIRPHNFYELFIENWLSQSNESIELRNTNGTLIDKTPIMSDTFDNGLTWQRMFDGVDTNSGVDWKFVNPTLGISNSVEPSFCHLGTVFYIEFDSCMNVQNDIIDQDFILSLTTDYQIHASTYNGIIEAFELDTGSIMLNTDIIPNDVGYTIIDLDRSLIDSKSNGQDIDFVVMINGTTQANFDEINTTNQTRTLQIHFNQTAYLIEITGTIFDNP